MRFQFWRDALAAIFSEKADTPVPQHPVAQALADARRNRPVMKYYLSQLVEVRVSIPSVCFADI
jgi:NADH dehydrogenase [ubiquinone] 1 alpha subcomplex assembly factor 6